MTTSHNPIPEQHNGPLAPETILQNRYRIVRQLGRGGMGTVYEAVDERLGITVALKETLSAEDSMRRQFEREARLLAGMQHPALPRVSDHFVEGSRAFLVMEFIGGIDLAKIIAQQPGPFPRDQVIVWADQLLDALIYLHSRDRQVIHRDIKPHNLKLTAGGQIALLDFGLARAQANDPSVTASQAFYGYTRHYAPLEQIQDQRTDPRSDIYALGATLYHLLTGAKPPDAMVRASSVVNGGADPLKLANFVHAAVGPQISAILCKAMALKPEERYENATQFRESLRRIGRAREVEVKAARKVATPKVQAKELVVTQRRPAVPAEMNLTLVGSARRFGPAGATAVLALAIALGVGILYSAQRLFPDEVLPNIDKAVSDTTSAMRQSTSARKPERNKTVESAIVAEPKVTEPNITEPKPREVDRAVPAKLEVASAKAQPEKRQLAAGKSSVTPARVHDSSRKSAKPVGAPSIRLPKPDFSDDAPIAAPDSRVRATKVSAAAPDSRVRITKVSVAAPDSRVRTTKVSSSAHTSRAPQFFMGKDGTAMVKFGNSSTWYIYPGRTIDRLRAAIAGRH